MKLHIKTRQGLRPDVLEKLSGSKAADEAAWVTALCLTEHSSRELLPNQELARVFALVIHKLARGRAINFLFWSDKAQVKRNLQNLDVRKTEDAKALLVEIPSQELLTLRKLLEAGAFTTFYGWIDGIVTPDKPTSLFESLGTIDFVAVFSLYDETIEILSRLVPNDFLIPAIRNVGVETGIEVV